MVALDSLPDVAWETIPCPMGCPVADVPVISGSDRLHGRPGVFHVVRCQTCGLMRTTPRPSPSSMQSFYPADYKPFTPVTGRSGTSARLVRRLCDSKMQALPPVPPGRLLELGCASGDFLQRMQDEGWTVEGIEPSPHAAEVARSRGFNVHYGSIEAVEPPADARYDLIAAWMVLEHTHDPLGALSRARAWAKPGAVLAISVPNAASAEFSWFGDAWYALQLPTHLFHFTPTSVRKLLERAGWRVERIHHQRTVANAAASLGYRLEERRPGSRLAAWLTSFPQNHAAFYLTYPLAWLAAALGQTGRMTIWARAG